MSQATLSTAPYRNSNLFSGYYLEERVDDLDDWDCDEDAQEALDALRDRWDDERSLVAGYNEDTLLGSWIDPVLEALGYDTIQETSLPETGGFIDRVLYASATDRRDAMMLKQDGQISGTFGRAAALLEAKQWDTDFSKRFSEQRSYRDASHQVKYYLEQTPENLQWGILTNGRKWRLYGTKDYATETYYEIDLPEILESGDLEAFKYFYLFFRPEAFREVDESTFLDTVWNESETAAQELGEDLQDNVFTALRILGEGFVETNDLDIDHGDDDRLEELKEQSLVLLYRLMFVLYAESRHLISPDDPAARVEFRENFSLDGIRLDVHDRIQGGETFDDYSEHSHAIWSRLQDLFRLIDSGEAALGIPPYNGGLFDPDQHEFLATHEVSNRHIAEVIYRLGTTEADDGSFVLADYADLDTRHLGTIYEGLLEHEFRIAPEEYAAVSEDGGEVWKPATEVTVADAVETVEAGELYVVNDDGERKATGAYYTPDYVVSYIVEETVDPLLEDVDADLADRGLERGTQEYVFRFADEVLDLRLLDPAMGSGHFLTKATGYLTEQVMERVREVEEAAGVLSEQDVRRRISRECIYGVDLNGMAVELAKLSMWLETLAVDQPLAFLDHHLKAGNSLVGSDITEVLSTDSEPGTEQATLFDDFSQTRQRTLEHVMELMQDLLAIDNETLADIKSMEEIYAEIRADPLYQRLFELANVHTAERFGVDIPNQAYNDMADAIEDESEWAEIQAQDWFRAAQATAEEQSFFHWELEYPEVFFGDDGGKREDAGFDVVVGNPPYVPTEQIPEIQKGFLTTKYDTLHRKYDLSVAFLERAFEVTRKTGYTAMITPVAWETGENYTKFRTKRIASGEAGLIEIVNLPFDVFPEAYVDTNIAIFRVEGDEPPGFKVKEFEKQIKIEHVETLRGNREFVSYSSLKTDPNSKIYFSPSHYDLLQTYDSKEFIELGEITKSQQGIVASFFEYSDKKESENYLPYRDCDVYRYSITPTEKKYIDFSKNESQREYYEKPRILLRRLISRDDRLMAAYTEETFVVKKDLNPFIKDANDLSLRYILACLNSSLLSYLYVTSSALAQKDDFRQTTLSEVRSLPIRRLEVAEGQGSHHNISNWREIDNDEILSEVRKFEREGDEAKIQSFIVELTESLEHERNNRGELNTNLEDHLGTYEDGLTLSEIGFTQPPENAADSVLQQTTKEKPNLRVGDAEVHRESPTTVEIRLTARYKPDDDSLKSDQWGYTETNPLPALRITDLTETEADLIEAFVPVAVDEAGGFANFRETATKTNSLVDRLRKLTLPRLSDVEDGLESYIETKERADELEEKIQRTDRLIDEIVYELYGLTDEEIEIVEESVGT